MSAGPYADRVPAVEIGWGWDRAWGWHEASGVGQTARAPDGVPFEHTALILSSWGGHEKNFVESILPDSKKSRTFCKTIQFYAQRVDFSENLCQNWVTLNRVIAMQVKERLIKEIKDLPPEDVMNVYEMVLDLKRQKALPPIGRKRAYLEVQEILKNYTGSLSQDISMIREDRLWFCFSIPPHSSNFFTARRVLMWSFQCFSHEKCKNLVGHIWGTFFRLMCEK